jgi:DEAD/DEAH box helicase domain-containing protein
MTMRGGPRPGYDPTLFLYEHVPGGTGLSERIWQNRNELLFRAERLIAGCPCEHGCPSCVGPADAGERKATALFLLGKAIA